MDTYKTLMNEYAERIKPLEERRKTAGELAEELEDYDPDTVLRAQLGVLARKVEESTATGNLEQAEEFRQEALTVKRRLQEREDGRRWCWTEIREVIEEKKLVAKAVVDELFPDIRQACHDAAAQYAELLDTTWADLQRFEREAQCPLSRFVHHDGLKVVNHGETQRTHMRLTQWGLGQ